MVGAVICGSRRTGLDSLWRFRGRRKYSLLKQINLENVASLEIAWTFHTGDAYQPKHDRATAFEATPLYVDGTLYIGTPLGRAIALDPVTGKERWSYDGKVPKDKGYGDFANRGVSTWKGPMLRAASISPRSTRG